jgi:hypothetical protein
MLGETVTKEHKDRLTSALFGVLGVAAGGLFQHYLTIEQEREKGIRDLRLSTYGNFFAGQAKHLQAQAAGNADDSKKLEADYIALLDGARFPIAAYAGKEVVKNLADYFRTVGLQTCAGSHEKWINDMKIYQDMRSDILQGWWETVDPGDLSVLLYSCTLPK